MQPDPSGLRLSLHHALPSTKVFVARDRGRVVGTVSLIEDSFIGLPMEELYREELDRLRAQGRRVSEVSALAIDERYKTAGVSILSQLILLLVVYAVEIRHRDDLCIAINPRHLRFYQRLFPYAAHLGDLKRYGKVNGAPAVLLRFDLRLWPVVQEGYGDLGGVYDALFRRDDLRDIVARLAHDGREPMLTPRLFARFFQEHTVLTSATPEARAFVEAFYADAEPSPRAGLSILDRLGKLLSGSRLMPA